MASISRNNNLPMEVFYVLTQTKIGEYCFDKNSTY